jgi:hypothetical protein
MLFGRGYQSKPVSDERANLLLLAYCYQEDSRRSAEEIWPLATATVRDFYFDLTAAVLGSMLH